MGLLELEADESGSMNWWPHSLTHSTHKERSTGTLGHRARLTFVRLRVRYLRDLRSNSEGRTAVKAYSRWVVYLTLNLPGPSSRTA
jgi:hypothetical protein